MTTPARLLAAPLLMALFSATAHADTSVFDFDGNLNTAIGSGQLGFFGATTSPIVTFSTASALGLPALTGGDAQVMKFPKFKPDQGLSLFPGVGPNGGSADYINQYTMGFDVLVDDNNQWFAFFNTNSSNANDSDFFVRPKSSGGGIGISGDYKGTINSKTWYRVFVTIDIAKSVTPTLKKYIDGNLVGTQTLGEGFDGRWSLYSNKQPTDGTILLSDNDGDNSSGYVNSVLFADRVYSDSEILAFGGPTAKGLHLSGAAVPGPGALVTALMGALPGATLLLRRRRRA